MLKMYVDGRDVRRIRGSRRAIVSEYAAKCGGDVRWPCSAASVRSGQGLRDKNHAAFQEVLVLRLNVCRAWKS